jgi:hypothetical protein
MEHDSGELVCGGRDGLRFTELAYDPSEEFAEIVFGVVQRLGAHPKSDRNSTLDPATLRK